MKIKNDIITRVLSSRIDWSRYPSIPKADSVRTKAYLLLHIIRDILGIDALSASEIASILSKKFKKKISHQSVRGTLQQVIGDTVDIRERQDSTSEYILLPKAEVLLGLSSNAPNTTFRSTDIIIPMELVNEKKDYIKKVVFQINGCNRDHYYDACATMLRRLFETLIIESYEQASIEQSIKDKNGNYCTLSRLIKKIINEPRIRLSSSIKRHLPKIKLFGDTGAHGRNVNVRKHDITKYADEIRLCAEELISHSTISNV